MQFSKAEIDQVLVEAQNQASLFAALNREVGKSKEFLSKVRTTVHLFAVWAGFDPSMIQATKNKDEWGGPPEEEIYAGGSVGAWMEEV